MGWAAIWLLGLVGCAQGGKADMAGSGIENFQSAPARAFVEAVIAGRADRAVALAADAPGGVNTQGAKGETALLIATEKGDTAMVRALLAAGADPNGGPGLTPLHPATRQTSGEMLAMLLKAGGDPDRFFSNETPLFEAALIGSIPAAKQLLDAGAKPDLGRDRGGDSPALAASSSDKWAMVAYLIERGASPWYVGKTGSTVASDAFHSRSPAPEREQIIAKFKSFGYPWPPPKPPLVRQMMAEGRWPPKMAGTR